MATRPSLVLAFALAFAGFIILPGLLGMPFPPYPLMHWAALWVEGQGMHLSANSISNLVGSGSSAVHDLVHFYDEVLSHYIWHLAIIGLSVLLLLRVGVPGEGTAVHWGLIAPAAVLYGSTYFVAVIEGATVPLGLPAAALVLFLIWFLIWGYFPEPSAVGIP